LAEIRSYPCRLVRGILTLAAALVLLSVWMHAQTPNAANLPDAPLSDYHPAPGSPQTQTQSAGQTQQNTNTAPQTGSPTQQNSGQTQSSGQTQPNSGATNQHETAQQQIKEQEKQRVEGIVPTFNVTYHHDAVPLTPGQKMNLALHSSLDPFSFAAAFMEAGYHEAADDLKGFSWGPEGYFERSGVAYLDTFDATILSNGVVPIIFRQDPRYFRLGYGSASHRMLYSLATNFIARNDRSHTWGPNYGNLLGNFAAGELANLYYPSGNSSFSLAATTTAIQIAEGAGGSMFNEFWPDISRRLFHKDPTHGLDAQARAAYAAQQQQHKELKNSTAPPQPLTPQ
jgi:hypothetical protein